MSASSRSSASRAGTGAPNAIRARPARLAGTSGKPDASSAVVPGIGQLATRRAPARLPARERRAASAGAGGCGGFAAARRVRRRRGRLGGVCSGGVPRLVVCGTMDEPARSVADGQRDRLDRAGSPSLPPPPFIDPTAGPGRSAVRAALAARRRPRSLAAIDRRPRAAGWRATASARSSSACCSSTCSIRRSAGWSAAASVGRSRSSSSTSSGSSLFVEFLALTLTPLVNEIAALHRGLPEARRPARCSSSKRLGEFYQRLEIPVAHPRLDRQRHRRDRRRAGPAVAAPTCPFLLPLVTGASSLLGASVRLLHPAGLGRLPPQGQDDAWSRPSTARCRRPGGSTRGRSSRPSSAISASGCAARSSSASRSGSFDVHRADRAEPARRPDLRAVRGPAVGHRRRARARPDHRPDHLGGPGGAARGDRRSGRGRRGPRSCTSSSSRSRTTSSSRRSRATPSSSTRRRSSSRSSSAGRWPGCSGRSWPCR